MSSERKEVAAMLVLDCLSMEGRRVTLSTGGYLERFDDWNERVAEALERRERDW
jgi:sulfur relay (sulfurtransferase) DsrC/TusE family protein